MIQGQQRRSVYAYFKPRCRTAPVTSRQVRIPLTPPSVRQHTPRQGLMSSSGPEPGGKRCLRLGEIRELRRDPRGRLGFEIGAADRRKPYTAGTWVPAGSLAQFTGENWGPFNLVLWSGYATCRGPLVFLLRASPGSLLGRAHLWTVRRLAFLLPSPFTSSITRDGPLSASCVRLETSVL